MENNTENVRINLTLNREDYDKHQAVSTLADMEFKDYVLNALRLYHQVQLEKIQGSKLYLGKNGKAQREILI